ncbi:hypothetical protein Tco_0975166 [Tanacetum coccineum]|uniref:Retrotransposon gag domain-containing protein n=1 Tax=Tanacetum coccineum TaxID=301880 RepID=A0ABQ5EDL6_9ASTR
MTHYHPVTLNLRVSLILVGLSKEYNSFVQNYNMHSMGKTVNELHAMLKLHEETLPKKVAAPALHAIRAGKVQKNKNKKPFKAAKEVQGKGKCYGTHICNTTQSLRGSKKLNPGALSLYVGNGQCEVVEAIANYHLCLPSGLVIVLNNFHYATSITRGIILVSRLYEDGFVNRFELNNAISVSKNNVVYFTAIPRDGLYEIEMSCSNTNDSSMYTVSNKRAKLNLGFYAFALKPFEHVGFGWISYGSTESRNYVHKPWEPEQAPPSPIYVPFVPEPVYPEFLPEDDVLPDEEQPLPIAASPTTESPGYIPDESNIEDGSGRDDEEPSDDDDDDDDDAEEEEHLAPADPAAVAYSADQDPYLAYRVTARMSIRPQEPAPFLSKEIPSPPLPIPSPPPNSPTYVEGSLGSRAAGIRQRDALPSPVHEIEMPEICLPLRKRLCCTTPGLVTRSGDEFGQLVLAMDRILAMVYGYMDDLVGAIQEIHRPPRGGSRIREFTEFGFLPLTRRMIYLYSQLDDDDMTELYLEARVNMLEDIGQFHRRTALLMDEEARVFLVVVEASRWLLANQLEALKDSEAPQDSDDRSFRKNSGILLRILQSQSYQRRPVAVLRLGYDCSYCTKMAPRGRPTRLNPDATPTPVTDTHTTTSVTNAQIQAMINEGVTAALAARDATRNGDDSHTSGTGARRPVQVARECTYPDFLKCQPLNFKGTEGVVGLTQWFEKMESVYSISNYTVACQVKFATCTLQGNALTWWNSHVKTTTPEAAHAMP